MPIDAQPQQARKGRLSYTVRSETGAGVEVLLKQRAFRIKSFGDPGHSCLEIQKLHDTLAGSEVPESTTPQRAWGDSILEAWQWAKLHSGWGE